MTRTSTSLDLALSSLSETQLNATQWKDGALLILAGPGSGKTQILTCRIGSLLNEGINESFKILALTFTNKAADEMKDRVAALVPGLEDRSVICTFHNFCGQVLRQHGVHLGISADFSIYSLEEDRRATLRDAIKRSKLEGVDLDQDEDRILKLIDRFKSKLIGPTQVEAVLPNARNAKQISQLYGAYEEELKRNNALDFNSLIFEAYRLFSEFPAIAARYRRTHPYWMIDEFQDTNDAQYQLLQIMAGKDFRNIVAVADDDQIIYQWNGASFRQIQRLRSDFEASIIQLPTNYRCPPAIVDAANKLAAHNAQRTARKEPLVAGKLGASLPTNEQIQLRVFSDSNAEATGIAREVANAGRDKWSSIAILARSRALLEGVQKEFSELAVPSVISQRRDNFLTPQMRFLASSLQQVCRPLDRRNIAVLIDSFNRISNLSINASEVISEAEGTGKSYVSVWLAQVSLINTPLEESNTLLASLIAMLSDTSRARKIMEETLDTLLASAPKSNQSASDLREDAAVWKMLLRDITRHIGSSAPLDQFLQELQLRSKEPPVDPDAVTLMTVHASKGREFDVVYLLGMAEDQLPSYQSKLKGDESAEMEEERRNCFVAITRAKEILVLSRAARYRGWSKAPSRFLHEMGLTI